MQILKSHLEDQKESQNGIQNVTKQSKWMKQPHWKGWEGSSDLGNFQIRIYKAEGKRNLHSTIL